MTTIKHVLDALDLVGLRDVRIFEEEDGNICVSLNRKLDDDQSTLVEFEVAADDDPE
ncbi:hypothetical protein UFOVP221_30 [uncultured Caudovirales phage]|uniref:Uncharacterized protein n=1 Tax=uncultured Caudovirales phage TaxID=2100421 RepID=A0A6J7WV80_9CAUD|nr:hypothetical protein UFOVP221_30 [uncultured Caudovirales phage]